MSFRNRLTLFFVLIVIVPMVSVAVVLFRLIDDNETGKADSRVAEALTVGQSVFKDDRAQATLAARRIAADQPIEQALRIGNASGATARARVLLVTVGAKRIVLREAARATIDVGSRTATAPVTLKLVGSGGRAVGRLEVSTVEASAYAAEIRRLTGLDVAVRAGEAPAASTLRDATDQGLPNRGSVHVGSREYRVGTFRAAGFGGVPIRVSVLSDNRATGTNVSHGRTLAAIVMVAFLILAFGFAVLVSRALEGQIGRFLAGARRLAGGDFSQEVSTEGNDEFAALGEEFIKMSRQLEARLEDLREERARLERSISRIGESFASNLDRDALLEIVVRTAIDAVAADGGRAIVRETAAGPLEQRAVAGATGELEDAIRAVEAVALESGRSADWADDGLSGLAFPLEGGGGRVSGVISVARSGRPFTQAERELFNYLASQAATSMENVDLHELVQRQAVTDELTGLFNHRRFQEVISTEVERGRRFEQPVGLVMLDIDDFKNVNDTYGHQQGDLVLQEVGRVLRESSREIDEPARYGGEELAVALPQTDLEGAYNLAERVRVALEELEIPRLDGGGKLRVTASFGVAAIPETAGGRAALIAAADAALYRAKRSGKNRTERADAGPARTAPAG
jgi:diguanylate cyclase (GGDEF)-like protein